MSDYALLKDTLGNSSFVFSTIIFAGGLATISMQLNAISKSSYTVDDVMKVSCVTLVCTAAFSLSTFLGANVAGVNVALGLLGTALGYVFGRSKVAEKGEALARKIAL